MSSFKGKGKRLHEGNEEDEHHNKKVRPDSSHILDNQSKEEVDCATVLKLFRVPLSNLKCVTKFSSYLDTDY